MHLFIIIGEKTFWRAQGENIWAPPFILLPSHLTKYILKKFFFLFSLQNFPFTLFHPKQTCPKGFTKPNNPVFPYIVGVHEETQSISLFNNYKKKKKKKKIQAQTSKV